jgi:hypothetical protein
MLDVRATEFAFLQQPLPFSGIGFNTNAIVEARDALANRDLDYGDAGELTTIITGNGFPGIGNREQDTFTDGLYILDSAGWTYTAPGDGTLTFRDLTNQPQPGTSITDATSIFVDVIDLAIDDQVTGVITDSELSSGSEEAPILGFRLISSSAVNGMGDALSPNEPALDTLFIEFENGIDETGSGILLDSTTLAAIFVDIQLWKSDNDVFDQLNEQDNEPIEDVTYAFENTRLRAVFGDANDALFNRSSEEGDTVKYFFLVGALSETVSTTTPNITPTLIAPDVRISNGSVTVAGDTIQSRTYGFDDNAAPQFATLEPRNINNADTSGLVLTITFTEAVNSFDSVATLVEFISGEEFEIPLDSVSDNRRTYYFGVDFNLTDDLTYFVNIAPGETDVAGFADDAGNLFAGITDNSTWRFRTPDITPPNFFGANAFQAVNEYYGGFDVRGRIDEPGRIVFVLLPGSSLVIPSAEAIRNQNVVGALRYDTIEVSIPEEYYYAPVSGLSDNTDYLVFATPIDEFGNVSTAVLSDDPSTETLPSTSGIFIQPDVSTVSELQVCVTDDELFQTIREPINIRERDAGDFIPPSSGTEVSYTIGLPAGFEFNTSDDALSRISVIGDSGGDITDGPMLFNFIGGTAFRIIFDITGTGTLDGFSISGLEVKATASGSGDILRVGGTANFNGGNESDGLSHGQLSSVDRINPTFTTNIATLDIGNQERAVALVPAIELQEFGSNTFSGKGVVGDSLFVNGILQAGEEVEITMVHTDEFNCVSDVTQIASIFDESNAVTGLLPAYYLNSAPSEIVIEENRIDGNVRFNLDSLSFYLPQELDTVISNEERILWEQAFDESLTLEGGSYIFDPAPFPQSLTGNGEMRLWASSPYLTRLVVPILIPCPIQSMQIL